MPAAGAARTHAPVTKARTPRSQGDGEAEQCGQHERHTGQGQRRGQCVRHQSRHGLSAVERVSEIPGEQPLHRYAELHDRRFAEPVIVTQHLRILVGDRVLRIGDLLLDRVSRQHIEYEKHCSVGQYDHDDRLPDPPQGEVQHRSNAKVAPRVEQSFAPLRTLSRLFSST